MYLFLIRYSQLHSVPSPKVSPSPDLPGLGCFAALRLPLPCRTTLVALSNLDWSFDKVQERILEVPTPQVVYIMRIRHPTLQTL